MDIENMESRWGWGGGWWCSREHRKTKVLGKETWIWGQAEHPWTRSAVINYVWMIYLGCRLTMLWIQKHCFRLHEEPAQVYGVC